MARRSTPTFAPSLPAGPVLAVLFGASFGASLAPAERETPGRPAWGSRPLPGLRTIFFDGIFLLDFGARLLAMRTAAGDQCRAFLWENGEMTDLNSLVPTDDPDSSPGRLLDAYAISESGQIVGSALDKEGQVRAFLLTPDTTAPRIECGGPDGLWHAENVSVSCTANDDGVGLEDPANAAFGLPTSVPDGVETDDARTGTREVCDAAGNCATAGPVGGNKVGREAPDSTVRSRQARDPLPRPSRGLRQE